MTTRPVGEFLARLEGLRETGAGRWMAKCPAHKDRTPSLSIRQCEDGRILVFCFAGCAAEDIVSAVGLTLADLFPERPPPLEGRRSRDGIPEQRVRDLCILAAQEAAVCVIAANDLAAGRPLPEADRRRVGLAAETLRAILAEVRHAAPRR
ncbi:MAG: DNA primase [Pseudomonadota bacterium]